MGPGDIKQKIDESGAKSNLSPPRRLSAPSGRGWGTRGRVVALVGALGSPAPMLPPEFRLLAGVLGEGPRPSPRPPSPAARRLSAGFRAESPLLSTRPGQSRERSTSFSPARRAPGRDRGANAPPALPAPRIQRGAPRPHQDEPAPGEEGRTPATQPPPQGSGEKRASDHAGHSWGLWPREPALLRPLHGTRRGAPGPFSH